MAKTPSKMNKANISLSVKGTPGSPKKAKATAVATPKQTANGQKREAEIDDVISFKKVKMTLDCDDDYLKAQFERYYDIEAQNYAHGINKLRLVIHRVPRETTVEDLKKAFPKSTTIDKQMTKAYIRFSTVDEAQEAFEESPNLHLHDRSVDVLYDNVKPPGLTRERKPKKKAEKPTKPTKKAEKPKKDVESLDDDDDVELSDVDLSDVDLSDDDDVELSDEDDVKPSKAVKKIFLTGMTKGVAKGVAKGMTKKTKKPVRKMKNKTKAK